MADLIEASGTPVLNPVTGEEFRGRIDLPHGFEYAMAEVAQGRTSAHSNVPLELDGSHCHMAQLDIGPSGVYR